MVEVQIKDIKGEEEDKSIDIFRVGTCLVELQVEEVEAGKHLQNVTPPLTTGHNSFSPPVETQEEGIRESNTYCNMYKFLHL